MAGPLIIPGAGAGGGATGTRLRDLRAEIAEELGYYRRALVTSVAAGDPGRYVVSEDLADDERHWAQQLGTYVYVSDGALAGQSRRVVETAYHGELGALTLSHPLPAPLAVNTTVEVTSPLPIGRWGGLWGIDGAIDQALARLPVEVRVPLEGAGGYGTSLAAFPWISSEEQTRGIYERSLDGPPVRSPLPYRIERDGGLLTLVTSRPYGTDEPFWLSVLVPADQVLWDGTTWVVVDYSQRGLRGRSAYGVACPPRWVRVFGMVKALQQLRKLIISTAEQDRNARAGQALQAADAAARIRSWATAAKLIVDEFPKPPQRRHGPLVESPVAAVGAWTGGSFNAPGPWL